MIDLFEDSFSLKYHTGVINTVRLLELNRLGIFVVKFR
jgi:hypothetical protein